VNALLSDPSLDEDSIAAIVALDPGAVDPNVAADCPPLESNTYPTVASNVLYKSLPEDHSIHLDVFAPPYESDTTTYPAMVMVHGGGWLRGCKTNLQKEASIASGSNQDEVNYGLSQQFLVFNINYRLSCTPETAPFTLASEENGEVDTNEDLCGWTFATTDDDTDHDALDYGAAIHDVEDAVAWAQAHANEYCPSEGPAVASCWNGNVELVGNSAGGNLVYMASGRMGDVADDAQVQAVGAWSGALKLDYMDPPVDAWPCEDSQTWKADNCAKAERKYVDCGMSYPTDPNDPCLPEYSDASPEAWYFDTSLPKAFFANGTPKAVMPFATNDLEVVSEASAKSFSDNLEGNGWDPDGPGPTGAFLYCKIPFDLHATNYLYDYSCPNETDSVYVTMIDYLNGAVT